MKMPPKGPGVMPPPMPNKPMKTPSNPRPENVKMPQADGGTGKAWHGFSAKPPSMKKK